MIATIPVINAFSINMCPSDGSVSWKKIPKEILKDMLEDGHSLCPYIKSYLGHADIASIVSADLEFHLDVNRESLQLINGQRAILAQYRGPRLPEGTTTLPDGSTIEYYWLTVTSH